MESEILMLFLEYVCDKTKIFNQMCGRLSDMTVTSDFFWWRFTIIMTV